MRWFLTLMMVFGLATAGSAHVPADVVHLMFQWPDHAVPVVDGNLEEYSIVPNPYIITLEKMHDTLYDTEVDKSDLDLTYYPGYNVNSNKFIFAAKVFDNVHERDNTDPGQCNCADDNVGFWIDGDHAGDPYVAEYGTVDGATEDDTKRARNATMQHYMNSVPPVGGADVQTSNAGTWQIEPPYTLFAWSFEGEQLGESTYYYEFNLTVWDDLDWNGPETSTESILSEGKIIGVQFTNSDYDGEEALFFNDDGSTKYDAFWVSGGVCCDSTNASDFLLAPIEQGLFDGTAVEAETWGRLKARFRSSN